GKFLLDTNGDGVVETPMIIEAFHGDINGEVETVTPLDGSSVGFGLPPGDTTNYSNYAGFSNDFNLCVNVGGAVGDISWLNDNTTPILSVQSPFDMFAPYDDAVLIVPTTGDPIVQVQGAQAIGATQEAAGLNSIWKNATFNDAITQVAIDNSATAGHPYYEGVFPFIRPANSLGLDEGVVMNWWDPAAISPIGLPWNVLPYPTGGTFHEQGLILNENMSAAKSRANLDDILGYILPRACVALDLPCAANFTSAVEELLDNSFVNVFPNPISNVANVTTGDKNMVDILVYDIKGQLVRAERNINRNNFQFDKGDLMAGMYNMQIRFEEGVTTSQIVIK
ncbi:T9SS type A sorting domain-containing protein, partial [bacterium]|nr:T9SS type A sorting domain-containing protein [bacterium]